MPDLRTPGTYFSLMTSPCGGTSLANNPINGGCSLNPSLITSCKNDIPFTSAFVTGLCTLPAFTPSLISLLNLARVTGVVKGCSSVASTAIAVGSPPEIIWRKTSDSAYRRNSPCCTNEPSMSRLSSPPSPKRSLTTFYATPISLPVPFLSPGFRPVRRRPKGWQRKRCRNRVARAEDEGLDRCDVLVHVGILRKVTELVRGEVLR